ncbi:MAG: hypothetical protein JST54_21005 [Deltaproteobacteria bacterium]|nr:hypothetical protein [Deltaproteobacteria bacterium]
MSPLVLALALTVTKAKPHPKPKAPTNAGPPKPACKGSSKLVGQCFKVHGMLRQTTGVPAFRLEIDGTTRQLGVEDTAMKGDTPWLPGEVRTAVDLDHSAEGDYFVCPLTEVREGELQRVCVDSVAKVKKRAF